MIGANATFFVSTPFIDAYSRSRDSEDVISFEKFDRLMRSQGNDWGEKGLGRALLLRQSPPTFSDGYTHGLVLAFGRFGKKQYVCVAEPGPGWYDTLRVVEDGWPYEWDVT